MCERQRSDGFYCKPHNLYMFGVFIGRQHLFIAFTREVFFYLKNCNMNIHLIIGYKERWAIFYMLQIAYKINNHITSKITKNYLFPALENRDKKKEIINIVKKMMP